MLTGQGFPRDKDELLREVDVHLRLGDIRRTHALRQGLAPKWWETGMIFLLFAASLGLLASLFQFSQVRENPLNRMMLFWFGLMILSAVFTFEFLLVKIYRLNRSIEILLRMLEDLREQNDSLRKEIDPLLHPIPDSASGSPEAAKT